MIANVMPCCARCNDNWGIKPSNSAQEDAQGRCCFHWCRIRGSLCMGEKPFEEVLHHPCPATACWHLQQASHSG